MTPFINQQHEKLSRLKQEYLIVKMGTNRPDLSNHFAIHETRIEEMEKFLGVRK